MVLHIHGMDRVGVRFPSGPKRPVLLVDNCAFMKEDFEEKTSVESVKLHFNHREFVPENFLGPNGYIIPNKEAFTTIASRLGDVLSRRPTDSKALEDLDTVARYLDVCVSEVDSKNLHEMLEVTKVAIAKMRE